MNLPARMWRVEWSIARLYTTPNDRVERSRNFTSAANAAAQVRAVRVWEPSHATLLGVWITHGSRANGDLAWEPVDPDSGLPELEPAVAARYAALAQAAQEAENRSAR